MSDASLTTGLVALSRFFVGDGNLAQTLERVAQLTVEAVDPVDLCGITMLVEGRPRTAIFTERTAVDIDQAQYDSGDGPCLEAFETKRVVEIPSTTEPGRWPEFRRVAADHGIHSTMSLPLVVGETSVGAMNLYAQRVKAFDEPARVTATLFGAQAAIVLANAQAYWDAHDMSAGLSEAMKHRAVIEQAKGILMGAQGCDEDAAFEILVRASQRENVKLREVARRVVEVTVARGQTSGDGTKADGR
jgi:transcriptional regulator with GAF, ATPase, and Fis domain